ncbi:MAG: hypothetical protein EPO40_16635 [Myxococcaceae bacterium]|nr:MAG: hypothetical protein EPO40_16635 [Myxococcaceae bacterium]
MVTYAEALAACVARLGKPQLTASVNAAPMCAEWSRWVNGALRVVTLYDEGGPWIEASAYARDDVECALPSERWHAAADSVALDAAARWIAGRGP